MKDPNSASGLIWLIVQIVLRLHYNIKTSTVMQCWHRPLSLGFPASSAHVRSKLAVDVGVCSIGSTLPLASTLSLHSLQLDKRLGKRMDGIKKKKNQQQQPTHSGSWCIQHLLSVILKTVWGQSKYKYISLCHSPSLSHTHTNTHTQPLPLIMMLKGATKQPSTTENNRDLSKSTRFQKLLHTERSLEYTVITSRTHHTDMSFSHRFTPCFAVLLRPSWLNMWNS